MSLQRTPGGSANINNHATSDSTPPTQNPSPCPSDPHLSRKDLHRSRVRSIIDRQNQILLERDRSISLLEELVYEKTKIIRMNERDLERIREENKSLKEENEELRRLSQIGRQQFQQRNQNHNVQQQNQYDFNLNSDIIMQDHNINDNGSAAAEADQINDLITDIPTRMRHLLGEVLEEEGCLKDRKIARWYRKKVLNQKQMVSETGTQTQSQNQQSQQQRLSKSETGDLDLNRKFSKSQTSQTQSQTKKNSKSNSSTSTSDAVQTVEGPEEENYNSNNSNSNENLNQEIECSEQQQFSDNYNLNATLIPKLFDDLIHRIEKNYIENMSIEQSSDTVLATGPDYHQIMTEDEQQNLNDNQSVSVGSLTDGINQNLNDVAVQEQQQDFSPSLTYISTDRSRSQLSAKSLQRSRSGSMVSQRSRIDTKQSSRLTVSSRVSEVLNLNRSQSQSQTSFQPYRQSMDNHNESDNQLNNENGHDNISAIQSARQTTQSSTRHSNLRSLVKEFMDERSSLKKSESNLSESQLKIQMQLNLDNHDGVDGGQENFGNNSTSQTVTTHLITHRTDEQCDLSGNTGPSDLDLNNGESETQYSRPNESSESQIDINGGETNQVNESVANVNAIPISHRNSTEVTVDQDDTPQNHNKSESQSNHSFNITNSAHNISQSPSTPNFPDHRSSGSQYTISNSSNAQSNYINGHQVLTDSDQLNLVYNDQTENSDHNQGNGSNFGQDNDSMTASFQQRQEGPESGNKLHLEATELQFQSDQENDDSEQIQIQSETNNNSNIDYQDSLQNSMNTAVTNTKQLLNLNNTSQSDHDDNDNQRHNRSLERLQSPGRQTSEGSLVSQSTLGGVTVKSLNSFGISGNNTDTVVTVGAPVQRLSRKKIVEDYTTVEAENQDHESVGQAQTAEAKRNDKSKIQESNTADNTNTQNESDKSNNMIIDNSNTINTRLTSPLSNQNLKTLESQQSDNNSNDHIAGSSALPSYEDTSVSSEKVEVSSEKVETVANSKTDSLEHLYGDRVKWENLKV